MNGMIALLVIFLFLLACLLLSIPLTLRHELKEAHSPSEFGVDFEAVHFASPDGVRLSGWWIPAANSTRTVIFLHGFAGSMDPDLKYVPAFHDAGLNVLMFDFRAHGRSEGRLTSLGALEARDVAGALDFVRSRGSTRLGLLGFSMGGRAALLAAAQGLAVDALISDCGPLSLRTAVMADLRRRGLPYFLAAIVSLLILSGASLRLGCNLFVRDPLKQFSRIPPIPLLLIFGGRDPYTRLQEIDTIKKIAGANVQFWIEPEALHRQVDWLDPEEYLRRVIAFFDHHLQPTSPLGRQI